MTDEFSVDPLNENTEKLEQALEEKGDCRLWVETYQGDDRDEREFDMGFRPRGLILMGRMSGNLMFVVMTEKKGVTIATDGLNTSLPVEFTDRGFKITNALSFNQSQYQHTYLAFG